MLVLSHRGYHVSTPENTIGAFEQAIALGVDGIETDVRISRDGLPILFHDRVAPNGQEVAHLARHELARIVGFPVPTLDEAFERFPNVLWNVEIKAAGALEITAEWVDRYVRIGRLRCLVTSFHHPLITEFSARVDVDCGILVAHRPISAAILLHGLERYERINSVVWDYEIVDPETLAAVADQGMRNFVWSAKTVQEHRRLAELRVEGVITDRPDLAVQG